MNVREILDTYKIPYRETGQHKNIRSGWLAMDCIWCGVDTNKFHLGIEERTGRCNCWNCGPHNLFELLRILTRESPKRLMVLLEDVHRASKTAPKSLKRTGRLQIPSGIEELTDSHRTYLFGRGLDPENMVKLWGLKGTRINSRIPWRIWIPVHYKGKTVSWTSRTIGEKGNKYISAKPEESDIPIKELLFGEDYCRHAVIVTEGPFDVFRIGPGAVATFGLTYTDAQVNRIAKYPIRVLCFDSEKIAQRKARGYSHAYNTGCDFRGLTEYLSALPGETHVVELETGNDPGEASKEEIEELRKEFLE